MAKEKKTQEDAAPEQEEATVPAEYRDDTAVMLFEDGTDDFEGWGADEFVVPRIKIVQPTSREGAAGTFRVNLTGEEMKELDIIGVKVERGRVCWDPNNMDEPICRSYDFFYPDQNIESPQAMQCARQASTKKVEVLCPKAAWGKDGTPPECSTTLNLLAIERITQLPFWLAIHGKSIAPFRKFLSSVKLKRRKLFEFAVVLKLKEEINNKGKFFVLQIEPPQLLTHEDLAPYAGQIYELRQLTFQRTIEEEEKAKEEKDDTPDWVKD